jgi:hypothetical protein
VASADTQARATPAAAAGSAAACRRPSAIRESLSAPPLTPSEIASAASAGSSRLLSAIRVQASAAAMRASAASAGKARDPKIVYLLMRWSFGVIALVFPGDHAKDAESLVLRHGNAVLRRNAGRVRYEPADRAWFAALTRFIPRRRWAGSFP